VRARRLLDKLEPEIAQRIDAMLVAPEEEPVAESSIPPEADSALGIYGVVIPERRALPTTRPGRQQ
jgi:hypothetical protein